ncbi:MAG: tetratricopeptide repeat protein [Planctomycetes bacterium]|nr:tetratricopeptide repeat protein [Planctomycetota bacterium]
MSRKRRTESKKPRPAAKPRRNYGRWRAMTLGLVYVLFVIHFVHWKLFGKTLAPLELNEVMHTLELGIITAGFIFMCIAALATLIFGRFFCSWGCHILALQDLCAWMLRKIGIRRPKQVRSRLLLFVPLAAVLYMFVWPQIQFVIEGTSPPALHIATDEEGWASFLTEDFARNLPGPGIAAVTFLLCGFVMVYLLGSRSFCNYGCPYGVLFGAADRFAPGRIRVTDKCAQCGTCTATCTSGVRVHEEVKQHGMIVNPACLKDLDCVAACPNDALYYGFGKPSLFKSYRSGGRFGLPYDFSIAEELLIAAVFVATLLIFRGLYGVVPFLMTLGLGAIIAYLTVQALRLGTKRNVRLTIWTLKQKGRVTPAGITYAAFYTALLAFIGHSAFIRYHEFRGDRALDAIRVSGGGLERADLARAQSYLTTADRWGLLRNEGIEWQLLDLSSRLGQYAVVETYARRILSRRPNESQPRAQLAQALMVQGRLPQAEREFRKVVSSADADIHDLASAHQNLGVLLGARGDFAGAVAELRAALDIDPTNANYHAELGRTLAMLGQHDEAIVALREALRRDPGLTPVNYYLAVSLMEAGRRGEAIEYYEKLSAAERLDPRFAGLRDRDRP